MTSDTPRIIDIAALRARHGLSGDDFAAAIGVSAETLASWEAGATTPDGPARRLVEILADWPGIAAQVLGARPSRLVPEDIATGAEARAEAARKSKDRDVVTAEFMSVRSLKSDPTEDSGST